jgi:hypothetical protein
MDDAGCLKGIILDGDGDVMYDLYKEFGIQKKVIEFKLSDPAFNVKKACMDVCRHIEKNLLGDVSTGVKLGSMQTSWMLTTHPNVEKAFQGWAAAQENIGGDVRAASSLAV